MYVLICKTPKTLTDLQLELFDRMIVPLYVLLLWRCENNIETEQLHHQYLKRILVVHGRHNMVFAKLGRFTLEI